MVVFERNMTITYEAEEWDDVEHIARQVSYLLHCEGLSQVSRWHWRDKVNPDKYGYGIKTDSTYEYPVYMDNESEEIFRLSWSSEATIAVDGFKNANYQDAYYRREEVVTEVEQWKSVPGEFFHMTFVNMEGENNKENNPNLRYDDSLQMVTSFEKKRDTWVLDFVITYNADSVDERKAATEKLVEVPLSDMRAIRKIIESVLETFTVDCDLTFMVDCISFIRSETTAKCEPVTIEKVMGDE